MRCYACGRVLMRAAVTVKTVDGEGSLGPACAIKAGLKQKPMPRIFTVRRRPRRDSGQMELTA
jgi:hypothetical protein